MMRLKKLLAAVLALAMVLTLAACAGETSTVQTSQEEESPSVSTQEDSGFLDASVYVGDIDNANIDAAVYLDYSAGIDAGVYRWIPMPFS